MKEHTTKERLEEIMAERGWKQVDILNRCKPVCDATGVKLQKNDLSQYLSGKTEPGQWKLTVLAKALDVSEAWLMGYDVPRERTPPDQPAPISPSPTAAQASALFAQLDDADQHKIVDFMRVLLNDDSKYGKGEDVSSGKAG